MRPTLFLLLLMGISTVACKKDNIQTNTEYVYLTDSWKKAEEINRYSKFINNVFASNDHIRFQANNYLVYKTDQKVEPLPSSSDFGIKTDLSENYTLVYRGGNFTSIGISTKSLPNGYFLSQNTLDSILNFQAFGGFTYRDNWTALRSDEKQYIFEYINKTGEQVYALVDFDANSITLRDTNISLVNFPIGLNPRISIRSFYNRYYVCKGKGITVIEGDASHYQAAGIPTEDYFYDIVSKNDSLFAFGSEAIYTSIDQGITWDKLIDNTPEFGSNLHNNQFTVIDNQLLKFEGDEIYRFKINTNTLELNRILADGLTHNRVTGIAEFNDTVYVSSTSGTFKKPLSDFFEYEEE